VRELIPTSPTRYASRSTGTAANSLLQQQIEAMAARLAQLEGGSPKLA
jgi:hypothetical protein